ncbi:MAG: hypothetical protein HOK84_00700 [Bacteroidetes bacterium]|nr:hypothetical protein [Bacteroidota bacterium]
MKKPVIFIMLFILVFIGYNYVNKPGRNIANELPDFKVNSIEIKDEFFANAFLYDQSGFVAALAVIGLIAAGLSTTNAQIFALGSELRGLLKGDEKKVMRITKIGIFFFSIIALAFSLKISDQIVLLARVSFAGTALMGPMILLGILSNKKVGLLMIPLSLLALVIFLLSLADVIPNHYFGLRLDLILFILLSFAALLSHLFSNK